MIVNTMNLISTETEMDYNDADELDEAVENIMNMFVRTKDNKEFVQLVKKQKYI